MVAKGADAVAAKIRELAAEHNIPLLEAPPLARALYTHTELGDEIPETLYAALQRCLLMYFSCVVFGRMVVYAPVEPSELYVPAELDPNNRAGVVS
ncbi:hypothetical protein EJG51_001430 [Undibacterium piscinae]|uniref:EscU/YscU/HrcU family type III secretion system export apparatus switch protein n=1 Tax=Undibacterium piscinae TaxID=2495591 RepID=A0A6M4A0T5_9BURK|nr:hypothetical protein EJG51_001430 [Undibacterium piscinae]